TDTKEYGRKTFVSSFHSAPSPSVALLGLSAMCS
ncbi:MAG: hypothetical protein ACI84R_003738, partial [Candidatus Azotimanducaceae bacterium]